MNVVMHSKEIGMNKCKLLGITVLAALVGVSISACRGNGGDPVFWGDELSLAGQVHTIGFDLFNMRITFDPFTQNRTVYSNLDVNGSINSGMFHFNIDIPNDSYLINVEEVFDNLLGDIMDVSIFGAFISPLNTQFAPLLLNVPGEGTLQKMNIVTTINIPRTTAALDIVSHFYVDRNANMRSDLLQYTESDTEFVINPFAINLRKGWNSMYTKVVVVSRVDFFSGDLIVENVTLTFSSANPKLRWVLVDLESIMFMDF